MSRLCRGRIIKGSLPSRSVAQLLYLMTPARPVCNCDYTERCLWALASFIRSSVIQLNPVSMSVLKGAHQRHLSSVDCTFFIFFCMMSIWCNYNILIFIGLRYKSVGRSIAVETGGEELLGGVGTVDPTVTPSVRVRAAE